jgi:histidinol dehydrogenase
VKFLDTKDPGFDAAFAALLAERETAQDVHAPVAAILADVKMRGDAAVIEYTERFDRLGLMPETLRFSQTEIDDAVAAVPAELYAALDLAAKRIEAFHRAQLPQNIEYTDEAGLCLGMRWGALDAVGLYVPGGKAAYPSSVLMNAIPARVAGVARIAMVVPTPDGVVNNLVLAAAHRAGVSEIYRIGGAQAVAALAFGTATIAPVDRIVGPGNAYVAEAKRLVFGRVGIDSIAGPSEVLIVADDRNDPRHIAVDLLAQAEHDELAQAVLITDSAAFARLVAEAVEAEIPTLPRAEIAGSSWRDHGAVVVVRDWDEAAEIVNRTAPEHLEVMLAEPRDFFAKVRHAGAAFLGRCCPEAVGDYVGGPNHVLPTGRTARFNSGLSVFDFLKRTTWIEADAAGLAQVGPAAVALAEAEGLQAHGRSVAIRLGNSAPL